MAPEIEKGPFSVQEGKILGVTIANPCQKSSMMMAQVSLRILSIMFTLVAIGLIVTDTQNITIFGFQFKARYSYSSAFRFLVGADAVLCVSSALSLIYLYAMRGLELGSPVGKYKCFLVFVHDTVMLVLVASGCAAATAIGYVGRHGEAHMTWQAVCDQVSRFCNKMMLGCVFSYLAFLAYFALTLISAYRLMSRPSLMLSSQPQL